MPLIAAVQPSARVQHDLLHESQILAHKIPPCGVYWCDEVYGVPAIAALFAARIVALLRGCHSGKQGVQDWATEPCQQQPTGFLRVGHKLDLFLFIPI